MSNKSLWISIGITIAAIAIIAGILITKNANKKDEFQQLIDEQRRLEELNTSLEGDLTIPPGLDTDPLYQ